MIQELITEIQQLLAQVVTPTVTSSSAAEDVFEVYAFSLVLEGVPGDLGSRVTEALRIPTIGIGAGSGTDGQVLVFHDMLGLTTGKAPKFVKRYANLAEEIGNAAQRFAREVARGEFPGPEHAYSANGATPATSGERDEVRYGAG